MNNNKPFQTSRRAAALSFSGILIGIFSIIMTVIMLPLWAIAFVLELPGEILKLISKINHWRLDGMDVTIPPHPVEHRVDDNGNMLTHRVEYIDGQKHESYTVRLSTDKPKRREYQRN
jgi:hypothetical protein